MHPQNGPVNKPTGKIFFKTQLVSGGRGEEQVSGNWEDDQRIIHRMKLCKKFYSGEECPYGERCNFLHEAPAKFREDTGRYRESVAISIGTTGPPMGHGNGYDQFEVNNKFAGLDALQVNTTRPVYWKTKLCIKWETTGCCPFGEKCHFAHGQAVWNSVILQYTEKWFRLLCSAQPFFLIAVITNSINVYVAAHDASISMWLSSLPEHVGVYKKESIFELQMHIGRTEGEVGTTQSFVLLLLQVLYQPWLQQNKGKGSAYLSGK
ncbi:Zinc finger, CCCH-type [Dillenia turbinata]|uniref:Zinc finger, CCCH-type n=1 Tax=Dillenia turbinata TaxID=194707 RepID=A0AAN8ZKQ3_9MAGN